MKRTGLILVLVAIICSVGFAEENLSGEETFANGNYRFASGGFWSCGQDFATRSRYAAARKVIAEYQEAGTS